MPIDLKALRSSIAAKPLVTEKPQEVAIVDSEHVPLGVSGLLAASSKLLHINRGLTETDDRDSYAFKTILRNHNHLEERINLDAGKVRQKLMWRILRDNSLKGVVPGALDNYTNGFLIGTSDEPNQLSAPLEETNPMHLLENAHRVTMMGDGGIGSDDQVTGDAQAINGSQFGFVCPIAGPECFDEETEVMTERGWVKWPEVMDEDLFACRLDGHTKYLPADRVVRSSYDGRMIKLRGDAFELFVTPNHMLYVTLGASDIWEMHKAEDVCTRSIGFDTNRTFLGEAIPARGVDVWNYVGMVYCATVPGGLLYTRRGDGNEGVWSGNSGRAGVDVRLANGVHISDSGKIYQKFRNARTKEVEWVDAATMRKKVLAMPE